MSCLFVAGNLYGLVPDDEKREVYRPPEFLSQMVKKGMVGDKGGQGFYKRDKRAPGGRLVFDIESMDYREPRKPDWPVLDEAKRIPRRGGTHPVPRQCRRAGRRFPMGNDQRIITLRGGANP